MIESVKRWWAFDYAGQASKVSPQIMELHYEFLSKNDKVNNECTKFSKVDYQLRQWSMRPFPGMNIEHEELIKKIRLGITSLPTKYSGHHRNA